MRLSGCGQLSVVAAVVGGLMGMGQAALGQAAPFWRGLPGLGGECAALLVSSGDEMGGTGEPALYAGGIFSVTGGGVVFPGAVARLEGGRVGGSASWAGIGPTFEAGVLCLTEADLGSGPRLFAGGFFSLPTGGLQQPDCVGWWDGSAWRALGADGYMLSWCGTLKGFEVGAGGEKRLLVSGAPAGDDNYGRTWNAATGWRDVGGLVFTLIDDAAVHDDGTGARLIGINGTAEGVFGFDGTARSALGGQVQGWGQSLLSTGEGARRRLYAGGQLTRLGGFGAASAMVAGVGSWDGVRWRALGGSGWGVHRVQGGPGTVQAMAVWDDGSGEKLWVGGQFALAGSPQAGAQQVAVNNLAWFRRSGADVDAGEWGAGPGGGITELDPFGSAQNGVQQLAVFDFDGPGGRPPALVVAGQFSRAGGLAVGNIAVLEAAWCGVADVGRQGGVARADGSLDSNDFVAFIDLFFAGDARADVGVQGGVAGRDGVFDNNDFVAVIDAFFAGCP